MKAMRVLMMLSFLLLMVGAPVDAGGLPVATAATSAQSTEAAPLSDFLRPDGTLDTSGGYHGSLDASGWVLVSGPGEAPRFAPQQTMAPGDELWADDFSKPGVKGQAYAVAFAADGTLYIGGSLLEAGGVSARYLAQWHPDTGWAEVGGGLNDNVEALALDASGNLYVGGWFDRVGGDTDVGHIAMWDGTSWSDLGGGMDDWVYDLHVDGSGNVYAGGKFFNAGGVPASRIAMWDGSAWSEVGGGASSSVFSLDMDAAGNLYAAGWFTTIGGVTVNNVAKWNGTSWSPLGSGTNERVFDIAVDDAGNVAIAGVFTQAGGQPAGYVAYWNAATATWSDMGGGMGGGEGVSGWTDAVAIDALGRVYAGGRFATAGGVPANYIAMWDGSAWTEVGGGFSESQVHQLTFADDGTLFALGAFNRAGGINVNGLALWDGAQWSTIGKGVDNTLGCLYLDGETLYAGVILAGGENVDSYLLKWNGVGWTELGGGTNGSVRAMNMDAAGNLYIGGWFNRVAYYTDNPIEAYNVAMWDGTSWSGMNGGTGVYGKPIYALAVDGSGNVYAGGEFDTIGGVAANNVAMWNGSAWSALGDGVNDRVYALLWDNGTLYAGGAFTQAGGASAKYIAAWNGASWSTLGGGMTDYVMALAKSGSNLYAGGEFTYADGKTVNNIARWDGSTWHALDEGLNNDVRSLIVGADGALYAGGVFSEAGEVSTRGIARWDGATWMGLGSGVEAQVNTMVFDADDNLYIGGYFETAGGKPSSHIAYARLAPVLEITKSATPAGVMVGETITYTLVAENAGASAATSVVLTDTVPAGTTLDVGSLSGDAGTTGTTPGSVITWDTGVDLAPGETLTRHFVVQVTGGTLIANTGYVSAGNVSGSQASNRVQTPVWVPSLALAKHSAEAVQAGQTLTTQLVIHNDGTMPLTGIVLTDTIPTGTSFVAASDGGVLSDDTVTWQVGALDAGFAVTRTCTVSVPVGAAHGTPLTNTAGALSDQGATATAARSIVVDNLDPTFPITDPWTGTALISPTLGVTVTTAYPAFRWHDADGTGSPVMGYTLVITPPAGLARQAQTTSIWTTQAGYTMTTALANGHYTWAVRAHDAANNVSLWVSPESFTVDAGGFIYLPLVFKTSP